jgi:two-component system chemotaxis sensor kinase CheA
VAIRLPLTLAILDGMSVKVGGETFIIPLNYIIESLQPEAENIKTVTGTQRLIRVRGDYLPLMSLHEIFNTAAANDENGLVVLLESDGRKLAVEVDELLGQQQVVIKNLETNYRRVHGIAGATILGDGHVALIVDVTALTETAPKAAA